MSSSSSYKNLRSCALPFSTIRHRETSSSRGRQRHNDVLAATHDIAFVPSLPIIRIHREILQVYSSVELTATRTRNYESVRAFAFMASVYIPTV